MRRSLRLAAISFVMLAGLSRSLTAQSVDLPPPAEILQQFRIDEVTEDSSRVVVRGRRIEADGRIVPGQVIMCGRGPSEYLAVVDQTQQTDDRIYVGSGFCEAFLTAARQRQDAKRR